MAALVSALDRTGADLVCSNAAWISEEGTFLRPHVRSRPTGPVTVDEILADGWNRCTLGATFAFQRKLWTSTRGFEDNLIPNGIDLFLPLRAALRGGCHYLADPLLLWRQHGRQLKAGRQQARPKVQRLLKSAPGIQPLLLAHQSSC